MAMCKHLAEFRIDPTHEEKSERFRSWVWRLFPGEVLRALIEPNELGNVIQVCILPVVALEVFQRRVQSRPLLAVGAGIFNLLLGVQVSKALGEGFLVPCGVASSSCPSKLDWVPDDAIIKCQLLGPLARGSRKN